MYRHNIKVRRQRNFMIVLLAAIIISITSLIIWFLIHRDVGNPAETTNAAPIITDHTAQEGQKIHINERTFSFDLPIDWKLQSKDTKPYIYWIWQSTKKNGDNRLLTLYIDGAPADQAINYLLPLTKKDDGVTVGTMSSRCNDFTPDVQAAIKANKTIPSRWQGINFICDAPNVAQQKVGIGSTDGLNTIKLTGNISGTHSYFFLYNDQNIHFDSSILTDAMESLKVK